MNALQPSLSFFPSLPSTVLCAVGSSTRSAPSLRNLHTGRPVSDPWLEENSRSLFSYPALSSDSSTRRENNCARAELFFAVLGTIVPVHQSSITARGGYPYLDVSHRGFAPTRSQATPPNRVAYLFLHSSQQSICIAPTACIGTGVSRQEESNQSQLSFVGTIRLSTSACFTLTQIRTYRFEFPLSESWLRSGSSG